MSSLELHEKQECIKERSFIHSASTRISTHNSAHAHLNNNCGTGSRSFTGEIIIDNVSFN